VFLNYILHWGALRFYALLKGALTEKSLRKADLVDTHTVKMNMLAISNKIVATDYKQYYSLNFTN